MAPPRPSRSGTGWTPGPAGLSSPSPDALLVLGPLIGAPRPGLRTSAERLGTSAGPRRRNGSTHGRGQGLGAVGRVGTGWQSNVAPQTSGQRRPSGFRGSSHTLLPSTHTPRELPPSRTPPTHRGSLSPSPRKRETPRHRSQSLCLALPLPGALGRSSNPSEPQLPDLGNGHSLPTLSRMLLRKFRSQFQRACPLWGPDTREQWSVICHSWVVPPGSAGGGWVENPAETWVPHL